MGKHSRAANAERLRIKKRNHNILGAGAISVAVALGAGAIMLFKGGEDNSSSSLTTNTALSLGEVPTAVLSGSQEYIAKYGCADEQDITFSLASDLNHFDPMVVPLGKTDGNTITISTLIDGPGEQRSVGIHETGHACSVGLQMLDSVYEHPYFGGVPLVGAEGFKGYFADNSYMTEMEEGVIEWLSGQISNYEFSDDPGYIAASTLTDMIVIERSLSADQIQDLQQNSNLVGYIALVKDKNLEDVNASDISDILMLYQNAFIKGTVPTPEELTLYLNFVTSTT